MSFCLTNISGDTLKVENFAGTKFRGFTFEVSFASIKFRDHTFQLNSAGIL